MSQSVIWLSACTSKCIGIADCEILTMEFLNGLFKENNFLSRKKYAEPSEDEGFTAVVKINFIPKFNDSALEKLYKMYLLEK
jgi:hypothetical protein